MDGKKIRLSQLYDGINKSLFVPIDHGITYGAIAGIEDYSTKVSQLIEGGADGIVLHKGIIKRMENNRRLLKGKYILHLSTSTNLSFQPDRKVLVTSVEEAIHLGAQAISIHINIGTEFESEMLKDFGMVSRKCEEWGMPLLAMIYDKNSTNKKTISHLIRICEEMGADMVKVEYLGSKELLQDCIEKTSLPVFIAGGEKKNCIKDVLVMASEVGDTKAAGLAMGRNIFQVGDSKLIIQIVKKILAKEIQVEEAMGQLRDIKL